MVASRRKRVNPRILELGRREERRAAGIAFVAKRRKRKGAGKKDFDSIG